MKQWINIFIFTIFLGVQLNAQTKVTALVDSTKIFIGDHLKFHLKANFPKGSTFRENADEILDTLSNIEVVNKGKWDTLSNESILELQRTITITSYDSGYYWIPAITFHYNANKGSQQVYTKKIPIIVDNVQTEQAIRPNKAIIREPLKFSDFLPWILGFLTTIALIAGAYFLYKKMNKKEDVPPPPEVVIPAHEIAFDKLGALKAKKLWQQGEIKAYQSELTYIVREYLENRYGIQALESTSEEILTDLKAAKVDGDHQDNLSQMFTMADMVKFAKATPPADANDQLMNFAEQFIIKTKQNILAPEAVTENQIKNEES